MKFDPQKHHRRSTRLKGYDYTLPGAYFVTLCTWQRECIFGEIVDGEIQLSVLGKIVHDEWLRSIGIRREIRLYEDEFAVMPNHLHGIVWIVETVGADEEGVCHTPQQDAPQGEAPQRGEYAAGVGADGIRPMDGIRPDEIRPVGGEGVPEQGVCHTPQQDAPQGDAPQRGEYAAGVGVDGICPVEIGPFGGRAYQKYQKRAYAIRPNRTRPKEGFPNRAHAMRPYGGHHGHYHRSSPGSRQR